MTLSPFHLAIPVYDLAAARAFYGEAFGCAEAAAAITGWISISSATSL